MTNTPELQTKRLILRKFTLNDADAFYKIMSDKEVNSFLPWFPIETLTEASEHLQENHLKSYEKSIGFRYAVCLKSDDVPIGYVNVSDNDSFDLGYGLMKEHWNKGIITEACKAIVEQLKIAGLPFITATHDVNNPRSGSVMKKLKMTYHYSYEEQCQPKDTLVVFCLYQLNFDGNNDRVYKKYWDNSTVRFVLKDI